MEYNQIAYENIIQILSSKSLHDMSIQENRLILNTSNQYDTIENIDQYIYPIYFTYSHILLNFEINNQYYIDKDTSIPIHQLLDLLDESIIDLHKMLLNESNNDSLLSIIDHFDSIIDIIFEKQNRCSTKCNNFYYDLISVFYKISKYHLYHITNYINTGFNADYIFKHTNDDDTSSDNESNEDSDEDSSGESEEHSIKESNENIKKETIVDEQVNSYSLFKFFKQE